MTSTPNTKDDALAGIRVLDFTSMIAGPYASRLMADLGAEVIKIEPPGGEDMRQRAPLRDGHSSYFGQLNAGKKSVILDLKNPHAIALIKRLVETADVLIENYRPGVIARMGLDYATLAAINPRLVYCSISGYGQSGPDANRPAYAPIVHAASGFDKALMEYAGDRDQPAAGAVFIADLLGGIYAMSAVQTALLQRARTGLGQRVDVALMDCMLNLLVYELQAAQVQGIGPRLTYGPNSALDGHIMVAPITLRNFTALCEAIGRPELKTDERFTSVGGRSDNWSALMDHVESWSRERTVAQCMAALDAAGVPAARYNTPADALANPHLLQRGLFTQVADGAGAFTGVNPPYRLSASKADLRSPVPQKGEHTRAVLCGLLGLDEKQLQSLGVGGTADSHE